VCKTVTLREEHGLRGVCKYKVLRRILGPEKNEIRGDMRRMHDKNLHDLYSSPIRKENEIGGVVMGRG